MRRKTQWFTSLEEKVRPEHTALIVVDMQNDYCAEGGAAHKRGRDLSAAREIIPNIARLLAKARASEVLIIFVKMGLDKEALYLSAPEFARRLKRWGHEEVTIKGTWGYEVIPELAPEPGELVVEKHRSSAFMGTDLDLILRSNEIKTVVVTGVVTQGCVNATAKDASLHDYYVVLCKDCVASWRRDLHEAALTILESTLEEDGVTTSDGVIEAWGKEAAEKASLGVQAKHR